MGAHELPRLGGQSAPIRNVEAVAPVEAGRGNQPSAAFEALLTRLEQRAAELTRSSEAGLDAASLGRAVDAAGESVRDALQLSSSLIEAYRAERAARPEGETT